ncbi:MAG: DUF3775 domain-containing protein [Exilibacterium sp.]
MLNVNPDTVSRLNDLAREFHAQEEVVLADEPEIPGGDWLTELLARHGEDTTFLEFKSIVDDLEPDQQQELVALLWLGREDFSVDEWRAALEQAAENWTPETAEYLIAHPLLPTYLETGLELLGYSIE